MAGLFTGAGRWFITSELTICSPGLSAVFFRSRRDFSGGRRGAMRLGGGGVDTFAFFFFFFLFLGCCLLMDKLSAQLLFAFKDRLLMIDVFSWRCIGNWIRYHCPMKFGQPLKVEMDAVGRSSARSCKLITSTCCPCRQGWMQASQPTTQPLLPLAEDNVDHQSSSSKEWGSIRALVLSFLGYPFSKLSAIKQYHSKFRCPV